MTGGGLIASEEIDIRCLGSTQLTCVPKGKGGGAGAAAINYMSERQLHPVFLLFFSHPRSERGNPANRNLGSLVVGGPPRREQRPPGLMGSDFQCPFPVSAGRMSSSRSAILPSSLALCDVPLAPLTVRLRTASVLGGKDPEPRTSLDMGPDDATNSARSPLLHMSHATSAVSRPKPPEDLHFLSHFPKGPDGKVQA